MNIIKPKNLKKGDTIGILALSGNIDDDLNLNRAKLFLEESGYRVLLSDNVFESDRYFAGTDYVRLEQLHKFFANPDIDAIICLRGGYGAIRLIKNIDYDLIRNNPKIFCGYSDVSAILLMLLKKSGLMTYHAPMIYGDFGAEKVDEFTVENFFNVFSTDELCFAGEKIYKSGFADGILVGGNLSTVVSLCGQDFLPDEKFIFFAEDVNEPVYKIDKMFTQLFNIDKFRNNVQALVLGKFSGVDDENLLEKLFFELADKYNIPVVGGFKISHEIEKITLPCGAMSSLSENQLKVCLVG